MNNEGIAEWLNRGCTFLERKGEIEGYMTKSFMRNLRLTRDPAETSKKVNSIYGRCLIYQTYDKAIVSFKPAIDARGHVNWEMVHENDAPFWQGDVLYGLDGRKVGEIRWDEEEAEWIFWNNHEKCSYGPDLDAAKHEIVEDYNNEELAWEM